MDNKKKKGRFHDSLNVLVRCFLFKRGFILVRVDEIEWLEASSLSDHRAQQKFPLDSWDRGYFNGLADCASKIAEKLKMNYPPNATPHPRGEGH